MNEPESDAKKRHRAWCLTVWDENPPVFNPDTMSYLLYAPETCPDTGKPHWQSYVYWRHAKTRSACIRSLDLTIHPYAKSADGSFQSNLNYIRGPYESPDKSKTKPFNPDWVEHGKQPSQGARADIIALRDEMASGETNIEKLILDKPDIYHQYGRTLHAIDTQLNINKFRDFMTEGIWYHGPTGSGKSHRAFKDYSPDTHYVWHSDKGWWDNYCGQETVIMNDFRGEIPYNQLLQIIDKWPYQVSRRGAPPRQFMSKRVIITSSLAPHKVYHNRDSEDDIKQLLRRVRVISLSSEYEFMEADSDDEPLEMT